MALLEVQDLVCVRGERTVFAGLDLALEPGEAVVLSGPNGSGKSSLLRLLAGLLRPAAGRILWRQEPIADDPAAHRARLAYVGHQDPVKPVLSVRENVAFWTRLKGGAERAVPAALERLGLGGLAAMPGGMLSAGQRRRLNLARLLAVPATLWLLDEPTVGLDHDSVATLETMLAAHRGAGGLLVAASHLPLALPGARELALPCEPGADAAP